MRYPFGALHRFERAFAVVRPRQARAAVFTEHSGYLEFDLIEGTQVVEIRESVYYHEANGDESP